MIRDQWIERLVDAHKGKRYETVALAAANLLKIEPNLPEALEAYAEARIRCGRWRELEPFFQKNWRLIPQSERMQLAYFDFLALSKRFDELFLHVWESCGLGCSAAFKSYAEIALETVRAQYGADMIEAESRLTCQLEIPLIDRILMSFSGLQTPSSAQAVLAPSAGGRIYLEATCLIRFLAAGRHATGIQRAIIEILAALAKSSEAAWVVFFRPEENDPLCIAATDFLSLLACDSDAGLFWRLAFGSIDNALPFELASFAPDPDDSLVLIDAFWAPAPYRLLAITDNRNFKAYLYIYDLIPLLLEFEPASSSMFEGSLKLISRCVDAVFTASNNTAIDVERYMNTIGLQDLPVVPVQLAVAAFSDFQYFKSLGAVVPAQSMIVESLLTASVLLTVSSLSQRKRLVELAEAFVDSLPDLPQTATLVIIGGDPNHDPDLTARIRKLIGGAAGRLVWLRSASDNDLRRLYRSCRAVAYPSSYEGWGLPVGEALAFGKLPIVHRLSSIPEVAGELGYYCEPNPESLRKAVIRVMIDDALLVDHAARLERATLRGWEAVAANLMTAVANQRNISQAPT